MITSISIGKKRYQPFSDEQLMKLIKDGNTSAFNELYDRYSKKLLHYFFRMLGEDQAKAQDFLQELFLKIIEKTELFDVKKNFSTWIFTVAHNLCKNEYRKMNIRKNIGHIENMDVLPQNSEKEHQYAGQTVDRNLFRKALNNELRIMDADQRNTFLLRYQQNFSIKEISTVLECSEGTIKSRIFYITKKLAEKLKDYNPNQTKVSIYEKIR